MYIMFVSKRKTKKMRKTRKTRKTLKFRKTNKFRGGENEDKCPICLEEFDKNKIIFNTDCNHKFHKLCLNIFCRKSTNKVEIPCPLCNTNISKNCISIINEKPDTEFLSYMWNRR